MIRNRKYARGRHAGQTGASHSIAIGFNAGTADRAGFGKLPGFCIFLKSEDSTGMKPVDFGMMLDIIESNTRRDPDAMNAFISALETLKIDYEPDHPITLKTVTAAIMAAKPMQMKAPDGVFPQTVEFVIPYAATRNDSGWNIQTIYDDQYTAFKVGGCKGEFCCGNGETASRWQPDSSRIQIDCNPVGKVGVPAEDFCAYSMPQPTGKQDRNGRDYTSTACNAVGRLTVILIKREADGRPAPLSRSVDARFEFSTRSEVNQMKLSTTLLALCERLGGKIDRIFGTLHFQKRRAIAPPQAGGQLTQVGRVEILINEASVQARQNQIANFLLEAAPSATALQLGCESKDLGGDAPVDIREAEYIDDSADNDTPPDLVPEQTADDDLLPQTDPEPEKDPRVALAEEFFNTVVSIAVRDSLDPVELSCELTANPQFRGFRDLGHLLGFATDYPERYDKSMVVYMAAAKARLGQKAGA